MIAITRTGDNQINNRMCLRVGQRISVGKTEWADWAQPNDPTMADVHFMIEYESEGCRLHDLSGGATRLNESKISNAVLKSGDQIKAGSSVFLIQVTGQSRPLPDVVPITAPVVSIDIREQQNQVTIVPPPPATPTIDKPLSTIALWAELDESAKADIGDNESLAEAVARFVNAVEVAGADPAENQHFPGRRKDNTQPLVSALRLIAFGLRTPFAVRWACDCIETMQLNTLNDMEQDALKATRNCLETPSLENRQLAMSAAEKTGLRSSATGWAAVAAAWSNGASLESPEEEIVSEPETVEFEESHHRLSAKAIAGSLTLVSIDPGCADQAEAMRQMINMGLEIASADDMAPIKQVS